MNTSNIPRVSNRLRTSALVSGTFVFDMPTFRDIFAIILFGFSLFSLCVPTEFVSIIKNQDAGCSGDVVG